MSKIFANKGIKKLLGEACEKESGSKVILDIVDTVERNGGTNTGQEISLLVTLIWSLKDRGMTNYEITELAYNIATWGMYDISKLLDAKNLN